MNTVKRNPPGLPQDKPPRGYIALTREPDGARILIGVQSIRSVAFVNPPGVTALQVPNSGFQANARNARNRRPYKLHQIRESPIGICQEIREAAEAWNEAPHFPQCLMIPVRSAEDPVRCKLTDAGAYVPLDEVKQAEDDAGGKE